MATKTSLGLLRLATGASGGSKPLRSAAIRWKGQVYEGGLHPEVLQRMSDEGIDVDWDLAEQGFVTQNGTFVTRDEASAMTGTPYPMDTPTAVEGGHMGLRAGQVLSPKRTPAGMGMNLLQELGQIGTYFKKNPSAITQMALTPAGSAAVDIVRQKRSEPGASDFRTAAMSMTGAGVVENQPGMAKAFAAATKTGTDLLKIATGALGVANVPRVMSQNVRNAVEGVGQAFYENPFTSLMMSTPLASAFMNAGLKSALDTGTTNKAIQPLDYQGRTDLIKAAILDQPITPELLRGSVEGLGTVYHGTTRADVAKIMEEGIKVKEHAGRNWSELFEGGFHGPGFYTTTDPKSSVNWAMSGAMHHRTKTDPLGMTPLPELDAIRARVDQGGVIAYEDLLPLFNVKADQDFDDILRGGGFDLPPDKRVGPRTGANLGYQTTSEITRSLGESAFALRNAQRMFGINAVSFPWGAGSPGERHVVFADPSPLSDIRSLREASQRFPGRVRPRAGMPISNALYYLE